MKTSILILLIMLGVYPQSDTTSNKRVIMAEAQWYKDEAKKNNEIIINYMILYQTGNYWITKDTTVN